MIKSALTSLRTIPSDWLRDANSFLLSALCHLVALVLLALLTMSTNNGLGDLELFAQIADGYDSPAGSEALDDSLAEFQVEQVDAAEAAGPVTLFDSSTVAVSDFAPLESPLSAQAGGGLEGQSVGDGGGELPAGGGTGGADFFGIGGKGGSFVYVVDMSGSMNEGGKWERAREELLRSIEHLDQDQRYFIIFYSDGWFPMNADGPVLATERQVDRTRRWVRRIWPGGGTFPLEALLHALALEPDAIYFLSDGRFDPAVIDALRVQNPTSNGQIPIHTVAFVNHETIGIMRAIAKNSGGKFRFVE
jgi:hypothetical protein